MKPVKLAASVPKSTLERAKDCLAAVCPLNQWEWQVVSESGKEYKIHLHEAADGWYGYCTCTSFRMNLNRAKNGEPVRPCKHLVAIKRMHEENPEALAMDEAQTAPEGAAEEVKPEKQEERKEVTAPTLSFAPVVPSGETAPAARPGELPIEADPQAAARAMAQFEAVKRAIVTKEDVVHSRGKEYIRRSGFRKIALAYRISTQLLARKWEQAGGEVIAYAAYRAIAPNGRYADGEGWCSLSEANVKRLAGSKGMEGKQYHVAAAIAATRAINRAIADLIGGGQVSAEEVDAEFYEEG